MELKKRPLLVLGILIVVVPGVCGENKYGCTGGSAGTASLCGYCEYDAGLSTLESWEYGWKHHRGLWYYGLTPDDVSFPQFPDSPCQVPDCVLHYCGTNNHPCDDPGQYGVGNADCSDMSEEDAYHIGGYTWCGSFDRTCECHPGFIFNKDRNACVTEYYCTGPPPGTNTEISRYWGEAYPQGFTFPASHTPPGPGKWKYDQNYVFTDDSSDTPCIWQCKYGFERDGASQDCIDIRPCSTDPGGACAGKDGAVCTPSGMELSNPGGGIPELPYASLSTPSNTECPGATPICNCAECNAGYIWLGGKCDTLQTPCDPYVSTWACFLYGSVSDCLGSGIYARKACCSSYPTDYNYNYWVDIEVIP